MAKLGIPNKYITRDIISNITGQEVEGKKILSGFIPYNSQSVDINGSLEVITPSAFTKSLQESNIVALIDHSTSKIIGSTRNGTMRLESRDDGLYVEVDLPDTTYANDAWQVLNRGDVNTMSFGFAPVKVDTNNGVDYLREVKLYEISFLVAFPAYEDTSSIAVTRDRFNLIKQKRNVDLEMLTEILSKDKEEISDEDKTNLKEILDSISRLYTVETESESDTKIIAEEPEPDTKSTLLESLKKLVELETLM